MEALGLSGVGWHVPGRLQERAGAGLHMALISLYSATRCWAT